MKKRRKESRRTEGNSKCFFLGKRKKGSDTIGNINSIENYFKYSIEFIAFNLRYFRNQ